MPGLVGSQFPRHECGDHRICLRDLKEEEHSSLEMPDINSC